jgi:hypothetical protein
MKAVVIFEESLRVSRTAKYYIAGKIFFTGDAVTNSDPAVL